MVPCYLVLRLLADVFPNYRFLAGTKLHRMMYRTALRTLNTPFVSMKHN
jgi:hypothetical protein